MLHDNVVVCFPGDSALGCFWCICVDPLSMGVGYCVHILGDVGARHDARSVLPGDSPVKTFGCFQCPFGSWIPGLHNSW